MDIGELRRAIDGLDDSVPIALASENEGGIFREADSHSKSDVFYSGNPANMDIWGVEDAPDDAEPVFILFPTGK